MMPDLQKRFGYHPPSTEAVAREHEWARTEIGGLARDIVQQFSGDSREMAIVMTKLEEALFWLNAHIARNNNPSSG